MELLYVHEHLSCKNYISDFHIGFSIRELKKRDTLVFEDKFFNYMLFIKEGSLLVTNEAFENVPLEKNEMMFAAHNTDFSARVESDTRLLLLSFNNPIHLCENLTMEDLKETEYEIADSYRLPIDYSMQMVIDSIGFYLEYKIQCRHLHADKQREVFMVLANFYTKQQVAGFLASLFENNQMDFKAFVLKNYQEVKTVEELAKLSKSSVRSLTRKFRIHFGDSPYSWMLKQRSMHIKARLADPKVTISDIVKEFGFSSPAHFTSYCKKYFGETPSKMRKASRNLQN